MLLSAGQKNTRQDRNIQKRLGKKKKKIPIHSKNDITIIAVYFSKQKTYLCTRKCDKTFDASEETEYSSSCVMFNLNKVK